MIKFKPLFFVAVATFMFVSSCKKPENGNKLTLTTKKHRLTERWTMSKGKVGVTQYVNGSAYNSNFELKQGSGILTQTGTMIAYSLSYNLYLEFKKDGRLSLTEDFNGLTMAAEGTWDFNKKDKEKEQKAKEEVKLSLTNIKSGLIEDHLFNHFVTGLDYSLNVLSKDELTMSSSTIYYYKGNEKWTIQSEYTFKKQ
jgi:hypothetical protein